eukprot:9243550-Pyramimonas_sp.AAC.1
MPSGGSLGVGGGRVSGAGSARCSLGSTLDMAAVSGGAVAGWCSLGLVARPSTTSLTQGQGFDHPPVGGMPS